MDVDVKYFALIFSYIRDVVKLRYLLSEHHRGLCHPPPLYTDTDTTYSRHL